MQPFLIVAPPDTRVNQAERDMNAGLSIGSVRAGHSPLDELGIGIMLAKRFTIVCLLVAIFGMSMASIVAQSEPPRQQWQPSAQAVFPLERSY